MRVGSIPVGSNKRFDYIINSIAREILRYFSRYAIWVPLNFIGALKRYIKFTYSIQQALALHTGWDIYAYYVQINNKVKI